MEGKEQSFAGMADSQILKGGHAEVSLHTGGAQACDDQGGELQQKHNEVASIQNYSVPKSLFAIRVLATYMPPASLSGRSERLGGLTAGE